MIYYLSAIFSIFFFLPTEGLNWHALIWWWAADNPIYIGWPETKIAGESLYYFIMGLLYVVLVLLPTFLCIGIPYTTQQLARLFPPGGVHHWANNCIRLSLDAISWIRAPFEFRNDRLCWIERNLAVIALMGLVWEVLLAPYLSPLLGFSLHFNPGTPPLAIAIVIVVAFGRLETKFFWIVNAALRTASN